MNESGTQVVAKRIMTSSSSPPPQISIELLSALNALAVGIRNEEDPVVLENLRAHVYETLMSSPMLLDQTVRIACARVTRGLLGFEEIADIALSLYLAECMEEMNA